MRAQSPPAPPYRRRILLFLFSALLVLILSNVGYQALDTLRSLDSIEAARDQWQRPSEVLNAMDLKPTGRAVDLGSGSGYFSLKLASLVGLRGEVLAVDIRRLPLAFLWLRSRLRGQRHLTVLLADPRGPRLPPDAVDAVLICNTYHELADPDSVRAAAFQMLRRQGTLVVLDRAPSPDHESGEHHVAAASVESELRQTGFDIVNRDNRFTRDPDGNQWWLIVARKP